MPAFPALSSLGGVLGRGTAIAEVAAGPAEPHGACRPFISLSRIGHLLLAFPDVCLYHTWMRLSVFIRASSKALDGWELVLFILFEFLIMFKMFQEPSGDTKASENTVSGGGSSPKRGGDTATNIYKHLLNRISC